MDLILNYIGIIGSFALAISGALTAMQKRLDPFGVLIIAFVTATGGGTFRDMMLEGKMVFWLEQTVYIYFILAGAIFAVVFKSKLDYIQKPLLFFDAIGLGLYTIAGVQIGISFELSIVNCVILGTITGSFGGVLRDVFVNEVPVIFKKEIYATVSILGGVLYLILLRLEVSYPYLQIIPILFIIILRLAVIKYNIALPSIYNREKS